MKVRLLVAESVDEDSVYALDPHFASGAANATREWIEARIFASQEEATAFCKASAVKFVPVELSIEVPYIQ